MSAPTGSIPIAVLGGTGYVAGEVLRLLALHPAFDVRTVVSSSQAGAPVASAFPHLAGTRVGGVSFAADDAVDALWERGRRVALVSSLPHGGAASFAAHVLAAERAGADLRTVDLSADFRFDDPDQYAVIYGRPHPAPDLAGTFFCGPPDIVHPDPVPSRVAHPGCFTTAVVLAAYPLLASGLCEPDVFVAAVTGSSGSGRTPGPGTHHPERRSSLHVYSPLAHRHEHEMARLLAPAAGGHAPRVDFVPHSGPFVRGIHATLRLPLARAIDAADAVDAINAFYAGSPFVSAGTTAPKLTEVVGTNRCRIGIAARGRTLVAASVVDNLVKGAAGGGIQWLNRMCGMPDETGLQIPGLGWY